jgi:hypothetical protein
MLGVGGAEVLVFLVLLYGAVAFALYWIIRLAVRHGIQDTRRTTRARESAAGVRQTIDRQQATYGGHEPE